MNECEHCHKDNVFTKKWNDIEGIFYTHKDQYLCESCHDREFAWLEKRCRICNSKHRSCCC